MAVCAVSRIRLLARGDRLRRRRHGVLEFRGVRVALSGDAQAGEGRQQESDEKRSYEQFTHACPPWCRISTTADHFSIVKIGRPLRVRNSYSGNLKASSSPEYAPPLTASTMYCLPLCM